MELHEEKQLGTPGKKWEKKIIADRSCLTRARGLLHSVIKISKKSCKCKQE